MQHVYICCARPNGRTVSILESKMKMIWGGVVCFFLCVNILITCAWIDTSLSHQFYQHSTPPTFFSPSPFENFLDLFLHRIMKSYGIMYHYTLYIIKNEVMKYHHITMNYHHNILKKYHHYDLSYNHNDSIQFIDQLRALKGQQENCT